MNIPQPSEIEIESGETVAIDLETYDPQLKTHGSGAIIGKGKVCGIALAYGDKKLYIPIRHLYKGQNLDFPVANIFPKNDLVIMPKLQTRTL